MNTCPSFHKCVVHLAPVNLWRASTFEANCSRFSTGIRIFMMCMPTKIVRDVYGAGVVSAVQLFHFRNFDRHLVSFLNQSWALNLEMENKSLTFDFKN